MSAQPLVAAGAPVRERAPIRVLIVDDSVVARAIIGRMIEAMDGFEVAAAVSTRRRGENRRSPAHRPMTSSRQTLQVVCMIR